MLLFPFCELFYFSEFLYDFWSLKFFMEKIQLEEIYNQYVIFQITFPFFSLHNNYYIKIFLQMVYKFIS